MVVPHQCNQQLTLVDMKCDFVGSCSLRDWSLITGRGGYKTGGGGGHVKLYPYEKKG